MTWYYANEGKQFGPVSEAELAQLARGGIVRNETLVWREGMTGWQPYTQVNPAVTAVSAPPAPAIASVPGEGQVVCTECRQLFSRDNAINYGTVWVCAACKPVFVQKLKEGASGPVVTPGGEVVLRYAGFWIRFCARFIDGLIEGVVIGIPTLVIILYSAGGFTPGNQPTAAQFAVQALAQAVSLLFSVAFNTFFIGRFGATPGKMAVGLKVVTPEGGNVSYMRAFGRAWADRLSGIICLIGFIIAAFDDQKRALHDHMCNTRVIYK